MNNFHCGLGGKTSVLQSYVSEDIGAKTWTRPENERVVSNSTCEDACVDFTGMYEGIKVVSEQRIFFKQACCFIVTHSSHRHYITKKIWFLCSRAAWPFCLDPCMFSSPPLTLFMWPAACFLWFLLSSQGWSISGSEMCSLFCVWCHWAKTCLPQAWKDKIGRNAMWGHTMTYSTYCLLTSPGRFVHEYPDNTSQWNWWRCSSPLQTKDIENMSMQNMMVFFFYHIERNSLRVWWAHMLVWQAW